MTKYLLLIWQIIPENLEMYLIPIDDIGVNIKYFHKVNHKLQNIVNTPDENDALAFISDWLQDDGDAYKVSDDKILTLSESQKIQTVIVSGFML
jgi:hypothetical protein